MPTRLLTLILPLLLLAACVPPAPIVEERPPPPPPEPAHPAYETFDPAPYAVEAPPPPEPEPLEHDVPDQLMAGTIVEVDDDIDGRIVQGFRIQLFTSETKSGADAVRDDVVAWWRRAQHEEEMRDLLEYGLHPVVVFASPFYRVRVGLFLDRQDASQALEVLRQRYPEAFIVPDTITIRRE